MRHIYTLCLFTATCLPSLLLGQTITHTINEVQGELFSSPLIEQIVTVGGIVTGTGEYGYFIQDGDGAWNGIFVYDNTNLPTVGDNIVVQAEVAEYFDNTELLNITYFETLSSGNDLPIASQLPTGTIGNSGEPYEGCLVRIYNAQCTTPDAEYGEAYFSDGSGDCKVNDLLYIPDPAWVQDEYYTITGPLNYSYEEYKIEPRSGADISIGMGTNEITIKEVNIYPNPSSDIISFNAGTTRNMAVVNFYDSRGRRVVTKEVSAGRISLDVSYFYPGTYQMECITGTSIYKSSVLIF
tara:strand:+ start:233 stop:1120 length:888 start_codon:yes stop_codon:yes gene_type:complete